MLKTTLLAATALTAAVASAQMGMMVPDAKASKPKELMEFINKDAYKKLNAPDAYILTAFLGELPGNYQTAVLRGLVMNAQEAKTSRDQAQMSAMSMAPAGDTMMDDPEREPKAPASYLQAIGALQKGQDATDQGLIKTLFTMKLFTVDPLMSPYNERALDAITKYLVANHKSAEPIRLKYTSLAPRTYVSPVIPR
jgi:hypothetical protein